MSPSKRSQVSLDLHPLTWYNIHMKQSNFNLAMDASDGIFAYYLCGVLKSCHQSGTTCPDPDAEALSYLLTFYADALAKAEADELNQTSELELS